MLDLLPYIGGALMVGFLSTVVNGWQHFRENQKRCEAGILEDLRRIRSDQMGHRVLPYAKIPVLKKPPPPPPASRNIPAKPPEPVCAHLFRVPVLDVWGTELAGICKSCSAQITNEEFVKSGW